MPLRIISISCFIFLFVLFSRHLTFLLTAARSWKQYPSPFSLDQMLESQPLPLISHAVNRLYWTTDAKEIHALASVRKRCHFFLFNQETDAESVSGSFTLAVLPLSQLLVGCKNFCEAQQFYVFGVIEKRRAA